MSKLTVAVARVLPLCAVLLVLPTMMLFNKAFAQGTTVDLSPTAILYNPTDLVPGRTIFFDSGVQNSGSQGTGVFNIRWFVDGVSLGYGSHAGVPANSTVLDGNSQFSWVATAGTHTITFAVDVDNHVVEANESNNSRPVTVTVTGPGAEPPAFTLFSNPDDPLLLKAETIDGNVIEYFGEKNAEGLATAFNAVHVESVINGPTTILLDEQSRPVQIFGADGVTLQISWQSETLVRVTAISADGTIQVSVPVDLTTQSVNQPSVSTSTQAEVMDASVQRAPRGDIPMDAFTAPLDMESSVQTLNQALSTAATSQVNVRRCGAPVNNATFPRI